MANHIDCYGRMVINLLNPDLVAIFRAGVYAHSGIPIEKIISGKNVCTGVRGEVMEHHPGEGCT
jgi:hypothetical protein